MNYETILTCSICNVNLTDAIENNQPVCRYCLTNKSLINPELYTILKNINDVPWKDKEEILFTNSNGCQIEIEKSDNFSIKSKIIDILDYHLCNLRGIWYYDNNEDFTTDPSDYIHDINLTLEDVLKQEFDTN